MSEKEYNITKNQETEPEKKHLPILKLSVSKTKTYLSCKKKFEFVYIKKMPTKEWEHHIFGRFAHKVLEDFHLFYMEGSTEPHNVVMTKAFKSALEEYREKLTPEQKAEVKDIMKKYLERMALLEKENKVEKVIGVEKQFNINIDDEVILNGMIDKVQIDPDGVIHVADYKTSKNSKYLVKDYFQLLTYAYVMWKDDPTLTKVRASYVLLRNNFEHVTVEFNLDEIVTIHDKYKEYGAQIREELRYEPTVTPLCSYCEFSEYNEDPDHYCKPGMEFKARMSSFKNKNKFGEINW